MLKELQTSNDGILETLLNHEAEWLNILQWSLAIRRCTKHGKARAKNAVQTLRTIRRNILRILGS